MTAITENPPGDKLAFVFLWCERSQTMETFSALTAFNTIRTNPQRSLTKFREWWAAKKGDLNLPGALVTRVNTFVAGTPPAMDFALLGELERLLAGAWNTDVLPRFQASSLGQLYEAGAPPPAYGANVPNTSAGKDAEDARLLAAWRDQQNSLLGRLRAYLSG
jgi:hypothetical protein